jgi:opacity protein-like surface antigen
MRIVIAVVVMAMLPAAASAQPVYIGKETPHRGTVEIGAGGVWIGGYDAGGTQATLTRPGSETPLTLFAVESRMRSAPGAEAHLGIFLSRRVSLEGAFQYSRPILRAQVKSDFESAPDTDVEGVVVTYLARGSLLYHFGTGRFVPFVSGGGGYLRQIDDENADLVTGTEIHAGGGIKYWFGSGGRRLGLRMNAGMSSRRKTVAFEQKRRMIPSVGAGLAFQF